ncbi:MAG: AAA family ATPase [Acidobacteria bacterium]|nr:AAA family ATPase [Acidobacteriota bacterium]
MDHSQRPSFADDPDFLASLRDLDAGLELDDRTARQRRPSAPVPSEVEWAEVEPPAVVAPRPVAPPAALARPPALPDIQPPPPGGRRRLLDLFPPLPAGLDFAPAPIASPPPRAASRAARDEGLAGTQPAAYETFYGLTEKPFGLSTDPRFLYHSAAHDRAAQMLLSAIRDREGLFVLTGEIGMGKTMLCRAIVEELDRRTLTSLVLDPFVTLEQLLLAVLVDFGVASSEDVASGRLAHASRADLTARLRAFVDMLAQLQAFAVVIIDEAQAVPADALAQIGAILDVDASRRLLQIVLVGQPSLWKLLGRVELKLLKSRVGGRIDLAGLAGDEIANYVAHRLAVAGPRARVEFDDAALARVYEMTDGVPRLVNLVCDRALALGQKASASTIDEAIILTAAEDLDLAPPEPRSRRMLRLSLAAVLLVALAALGAAGAAYLFRDPLGRMIERWKAAPAAFAMPSVVGRGVPFRT